MGALPILAIAAAWIAGYGP